MEPIITVEYSRQPRFGQWDEVQEFGIRLTNATRQPIVNIDLKVSQGQLLYGKSARYLAQRGKGIEDLDRNVLQAGETWDIDYTVENLTSLNANQVRLQSSSPIEFIVSGKHMGEALAIKWVCELTLENRLSNSSRIQYSHTENISLELSKMGWLLQSKVLGQKILKTIVSNPVRVLTGMVSFVTLLVAIFIAFNGGYSVDNFAIGRFNFKKQLARETNPTQKSSTAVLVNQNSQSGMNLNVGAVGGDIVVNSPTVPQRNPPVAPVKYKQIVFVINDVAVPSADQPAIVWTSTAIPAWHDFNLTLKNDGPRSITNYSITLQIYGCEMGYPDGTWDKVVTPDNKIFSIKTEWDFVGQVRQINPGVTTYFPYLSLNCGQSRFPSKIRILLSLTDTPLFSYGIDFRTSGLR